jgi:hypothetical protein
MSEKKITAVQFLEMQIGSKIADAKITISASKFFELINQAKDIDKEQKEEFFKAGKKYAYGDSIAMDWGEETEELNFEQYYNKNFKSE